MRKIKWLFFRASALKPTNTVYKESLPAIMDKFGPGPLAGLEIQQHSSANDVAAAAKETTSVEFVNPYSTTSVGPPHGHRERPGPY